MVQEIDRAGNFRVVVDDYGLQASRDSKSLAVVLKMRVAEMWNPETEEWESWAEYETHETTGYFWIVKKDGSVNPGPFESLVQHAGWDGNLESITGRRWETKPCQIRVDPHEYNGQQSFRPNYINAWDRRPGLISNVDPATAKALQSQYGSAFRALAGTAKANSTPAPGGKPAARPKVMTPEVNGGSQPEPVTAGGEQDVPF